MIKTAAEARAQAVFKSCSTVVSRTSFALMEFGPPVMESKTAPITWDW